jgi:hypothetical protein
MTQQEAYERLQERNPGGPGFDDYEANGCEEDGECPNLADCAESGRKSCRGCWRER